MGQLVLDDTYKVFEGKYVDIMPALKAEGRIPMSISALMKRRLQVLESLHADKVLVDNWWNKSFSTCDGVAYFKGEIKIVPNSELLLNISRNSEFSEGALVLTETQYKELNPLGMTYPRKYMETGAMPKHEVMKHPIWQAVAGNVLSDYVNAQFKRYNNKATMNINLGSETIAPTMRALELQCHGYRSKAMSHVGWSYLCNVYSLDTTSVRLIGVRKDLEKTLKTD